MVSPFTVRMKIRFTLKQDFVRKECFGLTISVIKFLKRRMVS